MVYYKPPGPPPGPGHGPGRPRPPRRVVPGTPVGPPPLPRGPHVPGPALGPRPPYPLPHPHFRMPPYNLAMNLAWEIAEYRRVYHVLEYIRSGYPISPADRALLVRVFGRPITPYEVDELLYYMHEQMGYF
ncbi:MAG: hypothetical protein IKN24_06335 [Lachnospiraceae bacterium]|nr:hypothetical protein [Lachnospiraceae bacterium]